MKMVFLNPERCIGCKQCQFNCAVEHSETKNIYTAISEPVKSSSRIDVSPGIYGNSSFPNKCRNCDPAACVHICPTGATYRDEDQGIIMIDGNKCITCAMCAIVCPFDALRYQPIPSLPHQKAVAVKCDQCIDRQRDGKIPACVEACKVGALVFGEINELIKAAGQSYVEKISIAINDTEKIKEHIPSHINDWHEWNKKVQTINNR